MSDKTRDWRVSEAKEQFSEVVRRAARQPQLIFNRNRLVAALVSPEAFEQLNAWQASESRSSLADFFAEARTLFAEEGYRLEPAARENRANDLADELDDLPG